jgi:hypothetical protein
MKHILLLIFITLVFGFGHIHKEIIEKATKHYNSLTKEEQINLSNEILSMRVEPNARSSPLNSHLSTDNLCTNYPVTTVCDQEHPDDRKLCLANSFVCNQFGGQAGFNSLIKLFYNDTNSVKKVAFANNQMIDSYVNQSQSTARLVPMPFVSVDEANYFETAGLIAYIFAVVLPPPLRRIKPLAYASRVQEYTFVDEHGETKKSTRVKSDVIFITENCSNGVYTVPCESDSLYKTTVAYATMYIYTDRASRGITYWYYFEKDNNFDQTTSDRLHLLNDADFTAETARITCTQLQNQLFSQMDFYFRANLLKTLCGSLTGTFGQNTADSNGFSLGPNA